MKRFRIAMALAFLLLPLAARAQLTTVTGTVTDPNSIPYAFGTISPTLVISGSPSFASTNLPYAPPSQAVGLDVNGSFTVNLADVTQLNPSGGTWSFHICSAAGTVQPSGGKGPVCFDLTGQTISGSSQSITTAIEAVPPPALTFNGGGGSVSITATTPIVATPSPITHTGVVSCPTCARGGGSGTANDLPIWTNSTTLGNSIISQVAENGTNLLAQPTGSVGFDILGTLPNACAVGVPTIPSSMSPGAGTGCSQFYMNPTYPGSMSSTSQTTGIFVLNAATPGAVIAETAGAIFVTEPEQVVTWAVGVESDLVPTQSTTRSTGFISYIDGGNATTQQGFYAQVGTGGTVTNNYGLYVDSPFFVGTSTLTHNYGIYIADQTVTGSAGTNSDPHGIYEAGTAPNTFNGPVVLPNLAGSGFQCLQINTSGQISGTGGACGSSSGPSIPSPGVQGAALVYATTTTVIGSTAIEDNTQGGGSGVTLAGPFTCGTSSSGCAFQWEVSAFPTADIALTGSNVFAFGLRPTANDSSNSLWRVTSAGTYKLFDSSNLTLDQVGNQAAAKTFSGGNFPVTFNFDITSSANSGLVVGESAASTGGNNNTALLYVSTLAGSTEPAFYVSGGAGSSTNATPPAVFNMIGGAGYSQVGSSGNGGAGSAWNTDQGNGGSGGSGSGNGGQGGDWLHTSGIGGNAPGGIGGRGGNIHFALEPGGSGSTTANAGAPGQFILAQSPTVGNNVAPIFNATAIWNTSAPIDGAILVNITNTSSGASSKLLDLKAGSAGTTSEFSVDTGGNVFTNAIAASSYFVGTNSSGQLAQEQPFTVLSETTTYQVLAADFAATRTIVVPSGTFTITLVASGSQPANGQCVNIWNYGTGVVTVARSGQNINGAASNLTLNAGSASAPTSTNVCSDGTNYEATIDQGTVGTVTGSSLTSTNVITGAGGSAVQANAAFTYSTGTATIGATGTTGVLCLAGTTAGVCANLTTLAGGLTVVAPTGTTTNPGLNFVSNNSNSGFIGNGAGGMEWISSGSASMLVGATGVATVNGDSFSWNRSGTRELGLDDESASTGGVLLGVGGSSNGNEAGFIRFANSCAPTSAVSLTTTTAVVCSWTLPAVAKTWRWQCQGQYAITAGTTPGLTLQMNTAAGASTESGVAKIDTTTTTWTSGAATSASTGAQTITVGGSVGSTIANGEWLTSGFTTVTSSATTFAIQAVLSGTGSPAGTILVGSTCLLY